MGSDIKLKESFGGNASKLFNLNFHLSKGPQNNLELNSNTDSSKAANQVPMNQIIQNTKVHCSTDHYPQLLKNALKQ
jgi:hypothetical protein